MAGVWRLELPEVLGSVNGNSADRLMAWEKRSVGLAALYLNDYSHLNVAALIHGMEMCECALRIRHLHV